MTWWVRAAQAVFGGNDDQRGQSLTLQSLWANLPPSKCQLYDSMTHYAIYSMSIISELPPMVQPLCAKLIGTTNPKMFFA